MQPAEPEQRRAPLAGLLLGEAPWRRAAFAAIAGGLFIGAAVRYDDLSHLTLIAIYIAVLVSCAATDIASFRVPNAITYPAILLAFLVGAFLPDADFEGAVIGGAAAGGLMLAALIISRGGMGLGDVKLATFAGLVLGWPLIGSALVLTAVAGGAAAVVLLLSGLKGRKDPIPYAPFISAATLTVILWQGTVFTQL